MCETSSMKNLFVIALLGLTVACGKGGSSNVARNAKGGIGQFVTVSEIRDTPFTLTEQGLAKSLCDDLQYRNANYFTLYGATKKFKFNVNLNECGKPSKDGKSSYQYKTSNGQLSFMQLPDDGPMVNLVVENDNGGAFKEYCDQRSSLNPVRYFGNNQDFKYYVFYEGGECPVDAICGDLRTVQANVVTFSKKIKVMHSSANNQFGLSLRGQEIGSETYQKCSDQETGSQIFSLDSVSNI